MFCIILKIYVIKFVGIFNLVFFIFFLKVVFLVESLMDCDENDLDKFSIVFVFKVVFGNLEFFEVVFRLDKLKLFFL